MPQLFIIKICFTIKVNSVCGAGRDTRILRLRVTSPKSKGPSSRFLGPGVLLHSPLFWGPRVSGSHVSGSQVPALSVPGVRIVGSRSASPKSWVLDLDFRLCCIIAPIIMMPVLINIVSSVEHH